jgi:hypothetical protein
MNMTGSKPKPLSPTGSRAISPTARPTAISGSGSSAAQRDQRADERGAAVVDAAHLLEQRLHVVGVALG